MERQSLQPIAKLFKSRWNPSQVQRLLRSLDYNSELEGETVRSAASALQAGTAHCLESSFISAFLLEGLGYPPLVLSLESVDCLDHVVFAFRDPKTELWGSIGKSREEGLHGRRPIFQTPKDLALSYQDPYVDEVARIHSYAMIDLDETRTPWRDSPRNVWSAESYLCHLKHERLPQNESRHQLVLSRYLDAKSKGLEKTQNYCKMPYWW